jgi:hypothetical protein
MSRFPDLTDPSLGKPRHLTPGLVNGAFSRTRSTRHQTHPAVKRDCIAERSERNCGQCHKTGDEKSTETVMDPRAMDIIGCTEAIERKGTEGRAGGTHQWMEECQSQTAADAEQQTARGT